MFKPANEQKTQDYSIKNSPQGKEIMNNTLPELKDDLNDLKNNVKGYVGDVADTASRQSQKAVVYLQERAGALKATSAKKIEDLEAQVTANPLQSVAIAFGAGILASYLFGRK